MSQHETLNRFRLEGRRVVLTGATGHIGRVFARVLADLGGHLVLLDRDANALEALGGSLRGSGVEIELLACDLLDPASVEHVAQRLVREGRPIAGLVHNAAYVGTSALSGWACAFEQQSAEVFSNALQVNLTAPFQLTKLLYPLLKASGRGSVVNIGSIYAELGPDWSLYEGTDLGNPAGYAASKGGLIQLTRWLATTMAPFVRVNALSPGGVARGQASDFVARYQARVPLGRMASEEDLVGALVFLLSDASAYVTGQNLRVDGGWSAW
jgi:NAD(P)-dependent dehydrogenase (short-subunit alcohol dehydrogenase family)